LNNLPYEIANGFDEEVTVCSYSEKRSLKKLWEEKLKLEINKVLADK
jgi:hypothetical protein